MASQPPVPPPLGAFDAQPTAGPSKKAKQYKTYLMVAAVVALILLVMVAYFAIRANVTQNDLDTQFQDGAKQGVELQKLADQKAASEAQIKDSRTYQSGPVFGNFEVSLPKTWSWVVTPSTSDGVFSGVGSPDFVDTTKIANPFKLELTRDSYERKKTDLDAQVKNSKGGMTSSEVTVSGIKGTKYLGPTDPKTGLRPEIVIVPLREKTFVFKTDDSNTYGSVFDNIVGTVKLNP